MMVSGAFSQKQLIFLLPNNSKASILIVALWSICFLSFFAIISGYQVRQKMTLANRIDERSQKRHMADAAVQLAIVELQKKEPGRNYDALNDGWSNNSSFKDIPVGGGLVSISYHSPGEGAQAQNLFYGLVDEESKININYATQRLLEKLFLTVLGCETMEAQALAASFVDWRDADSELSIPQGSAEDSEYRHMVYPYDAKDSAFEFLDEILLVKGMTHNFYEKLKDYVTVYGSGKININTASKNILYILGLKEDVVEKILLYRAGEDEVEGTVDDNYFETNSEITAKLSQKFRLTEAEITILNNIQERYLTTASDHFRVQMTVNLKDNKSVSFATAVIHRSGNILYWQEG